MKQLHPIQLEILRKLLFSNSLSYTTAKPNAKMGNNQFDFHLKTLMNEGLVEKFNSKYQLTSKGKEYANRMDTDEKKIEFQAKLSVWVCCIQDGNFGKEYLIGTRCKQPFFGKQGFIAGKIKFGETIISAAKRELKEETNLTGKPQLVMIRHYRVFKKENSDLLEDKFMFLCKIDNPTGRLKSNEEVKLTWIPKQKIKSEVTQPFESIEHFLDILQIIENYNGHVIFQELDEYTNEF